MKCEPLTFEQVEKIFDDMIESQKEEVNENNQRT